MTPILVFILGCGLKYFLAMQFYMYSINRRVILLVYPDILKCLDFV